MIWENLQDAGEIVETILTSPLAVGKETLSLLEAAQAFSHQDPLTSDLRKIALSFIEFKEPTEMMVRELDLILEDIS